MTTDNRPPAILFLGTSDLPLWTLTPRAHLERAFRKLGARDFPTTTADVPGGTATIALWSDCVFDPPVVHALLEHPGSFVLCDDGGQPLAARDTDAERAAAALRGEDGAVARLTVGELGGHYWHALRKRAAPLAARATAANCKALEWRLFMGTYKGVTDVITKHVWPWPAFHVTKICARLGLTPNLVTGVSFVLVLVATACFAGGWWASGLLAAWLMTFLDTVDGKLARITYQYSKWGNVFDHGIDLVHPPFWYVAWGWGVQAGAHALAPEPYTTALWVICVGYVVQRLVEGAFIALFGLEIHTWRRFDSFFRLVTARRNPNLLLMTAAALVGRPDLGLLTVAAWTALSLVVHVVQLGQAAMARLRGDKLASWLEETTTR